MKFIQLIFIFLFIPLLSFSQNKITLTGRVADKNNKPIVFANVVLLDSTNIVKGTTTNNKGNFTLSTNKKGIFKLQISFVGFLDYKKKLNKSTDLGNIILKENNNALNAITINVRKKIIEQKVDRLVFNVQNVPFLEGSDGIEILKRVPKVIVTNGVVSIPGKSNVIVMINDRITQLSGEALTNYLMSLNTKDIAKIEVITTPPAKYEASGNTGIINIKLTKKRKDYYSGSLRYIYNQATYSSNRLVANFNFKKKKLSVSSSISANNSLSQILEQGTIYYPTQLWVNNNVRKRNSNNIYSKIMLDYDISKNTSFGVQYYGVYQKSPEDAHSTTSIFNNQTQAIDSVINNKNNTFENINSNAINAHFQTKLDSMGKNISADLDYFVYNDKQGQLFASSSTHLFESKKDNGNQNIINYSGKIDIELPFKFVKITTGGKVSSVKNNSSINTFNIINNNAVFNPNQSNVFKYTENTQALYISTAKKLNTKWSAKIGFRVEATQTKGFSVTLNQTTINNYTKLFPTFYLNYIPNKNNTFTLDYGKRIRRPNFFYLNPFRTDYDLFSFVVGNPFLKPSYIDNIEISHSYKSLLVSTLYYSHVNSGFEQITIFLPNHIQQTIPKNYYDSNEIGIIESASFKITKYWESNNELYLDYSKSTATIPEVKPTNSGTSAFIYTGNTFTLNSKKTWFTSIDYWYQFPEASDLDQTNAFSQLNISFKALLMHKKMILNISGYDLLRSNIPKYTTNDANNIKSSFKNYYDYRDLSISLTYLFGNNKIHNKSRKSGNESERNRVN